MVHQIPRTANVLLTGQIDVYGAALSAITQTQQASDASNRARQARERAGGAVDSSITMIEAAVPIGDKELNQDLLNAALDLAIDTIRYVQLCVAAVLQGAVRLVSRATLPPMIPVFHGTLNPAPPQRPTFEESIEFRVADSGPPAAFGLRPAPLDDTQLQALRVSLARLGPRSPFARYVDLRREARTQRTFEGNRRFAVIALATGGEVLLDSTLLHMAWEERLAPQEGAALFDRNEGHSRRVARHFPQRLGGDWNPNGRGAVGAYFQRLVYLRHRVVHAGHEPTEAEMRAAWDALFALEHFLGDRLSASGVLNRYTRTAIAWMGENGLKRRNCWTRHVQHLVQDDREPNWLDSFGRYRLHVDRVLDPSAPPPGHDPSNLIVYADKLRDGRVRCVIHDSSTAHAAEVDPHGLVPVRNMERATAHLASVTSDDLEDRRVMLQLDPSADPGQLAWRPDHEVFPELAMYPGPMPVAAAAGRAERETRAPMPARIAEVLRDLISRARRLVAHVLRR
jgi:hypothetical protein